MGLWKIWLLGVIITIVTAVMIWTKVQTKNFLRYILVSICVILVGGIAEGWFLGCIMSATVGCYEIGWIAFVVIITIISSLVIWFVGSFILNFWNKDIFKQGEIIYYFIVFVISTIVLSQLFYDYNSSWEEVNEITVVKEEQRQLLYFCNIPVQNISGRISGTKGGYIYTSNEIQYWYKNENDEGIYDSASARNSKIEFIENDEKPYVDIITYSCQKKEINEKLKKERAIDNTEWKEYVFYLPEELKKYELE